jgi:hypothetical protein
MIQLCGAGLSVRHRPAHFGRRLVLAQNLVDDLAQQIVLGPGQKLDFGDQLGRTQCTRLKTSGEPKRLVRGGGTSSGIFKTASGCRRCHSSQASPD